MVDLLSGTPANLRYKFLNIQSKEKSKPKQNSNNVRVTTKKSGKSSPPTVYSQIKRRKILSEKIFTLGQGHTLLKITKQIDFSTRYIVIPSIYKPNRAISHVSNKLPILFAVTVEK